MGKPSWNFHSKMLPGFRNTKLWSEKLFFHAIFLMKTGTYSLWKNDAYPPISWFTFWSVHPKVLKVIFQFKALYFWNQSTFLNETFRRSSPLRFPKNEAILDGHGNCLMPVMPIFPKHCFFKKCPKNLTNFGKFKFFFAFLVAIL